MDSTLMFQDATGSLYVVLQLVSGNKAHPEKVFKKESATMVCLR